jgi:hypothetical protein
MYTASFEQLIAFLPVHALMTGCANHSRYQQSIRFESVHQVFSLINGSFGVFLIYACLFGATFLGVFAYLSKQSTLCNRSLKLLAFTGFLFVARLLIAALYFCQSVEVWQLLERVVDLGGGIVSGILLIGLPTGFLGLYLAQAMSEVVFSTYRDHIKRESRIGIKAWLTACDFLLCAFTLATVLVLGWNNIFTPLLFLFLGAYLYWRGFSSDNRAAPAKDPEDNSKKI